MLRYANPQALPYSSKQTWCGCGFSDWTATELTATKHASWPDIEVERCHVPMVEGCPALVLPMWVMPSLAVQAFWHQIPASGLLSWVSLLHSMRSLKTKTKRVWYSCCDCKRTSRGTAVAALLRVSRQCCCCRVGETVLGKKFTSLWHKCESGTAEKCAMALDVLGLSVQDLQDAHKQPVMLGASHIFFLVICLSFR
jgi:hypothetical protein